MNFSSDAQRRAMFWAMSGGTRVGKAIGRVSPGDVVPVRAVGKLVRSAKPSMRALRQHIHSIVKVHNLELEYPRIRGLIKRGHNIWNVPSNWSPHAYPAQKGHPRPGIAIWPITSNLRYHVALHELGHRLSPGAAYSRGISPLGRFRREMKAWNWAAGTTLIPKAPRLKEQIRRAAQTYQIKLSLADMRFNRKEIKRSFGDVYRNLGQHNFQRR